MRIGNLLLGDGYHPVALMDDQLVELNGYSVRSLLEHGPDAISKALDESPASHRYDPKLLGPVVHNPGKILCVGRNYADHAAETGHAVNEKPEIFMRAQTSLAAPFSPVYVPRISDNLDFEVELAVVIGKRGRYIEEDDALQHVAGYTVFNDFSIRDYQNFGSQWTPGKNFDGSGPLGPFLVTSDELPDASSLELSLVIQKADGGEEEMQRSNTSLLVHKVPRVIAYCSQFTTLEPGDVIATGTPSGVGLGRTPKRWLVAGETVLSRVEGVGELKNQVLAEAR